MVYHARLLLLTFFVSVLIILVRPQVPIPGIGPLGAIIRAQTGFREAEGLAVIPGETSISQTYFCTGFTSWILRASCRSSWKPRRVSLV